MLAAQTQQDESSSPSCIGFRVQGLGFRVQGRLDIFAKICQGGYM